MVQENLLKNVMTCFVSEAFLSVFVYFYVTVINIWDINVFKLSFVMIQQ